MAKSASGNDRMQTKAEQLTGQGKKTWNWGYNANIFKRASFSGENLYISFFYSFMEKYIKLDLSAFYPNTSHWQDKIKNLINSCSFSLCLGLFWIWQCTDTAILRWYNYNWVDPSRLINTWVCFLTILGLNKCLAHLSQKLRDVPNFGKTWKERFRLNNHIVNCIKDCFFKIPSHTGLYWIEASYISTIVVMDPLNNVTWKNKTKKGATLPLGELWSQVLGWHKIWHLPF